MAEIIEIENLSMPEILPYTITSEIQLKRWFEPDSCGIFIAESPKVIRLALDSGYEPLSVLAEKKYISGQASDIIKRCGNIKVYTAESDVLTKITGFRLTQGILCAMRRKKLPELPEILGKYKRIAVLEDVMNQTNIGAVIRSAIAMKFEAVILTPASSDPLYRRSVRVSMGNVFRIPWAYFPDGNYIEILKEYGFSTLAMALHDNTVDIDNPVLKSLEKIAVILGTEGEGLKQSTIESCDFTVKIPMADGVDSLNVASASAVAFWELNKR
ncbi:MAG: RNA methyltransferase [Ruminococcus sp.]|nr:RNA methyltransferase [Ruminococcus sp.]